MTQTFVIPIAAIGAPRMTRRDTWKKRPCVVAYHQWRDIVRAHCKDVPSADRVEALRVYCRFVPPGSMRRRKVVCGSLKRTKPDVDNIAKAVMDCLWEQDQAIADVRVRKVWSLDENMQIEIESAPSAE